MAMAVTVAGLAGLAEMAGLAGLTALTLLTVLYQQRPIGATGMTWTYMSDGVEWMDCYH